MPPRRRPNSPPDPSSPRPASPSPDRDQSPEDETDDLSDSSSLPFYNTTFSAHRVSPLYLGNEPLTPNRLQILAQRLRDRLVGDVVRGVEVGLGPDGGDSALGRAGVLERVEIRWVSVAAVLDVSLEELGSWEADGDDDTAEWPRGAGELQSKKALHISLGYELASCTALLLPSLTGGERDGASARKARFSVGVRGDDMDAEEQAVDPTHFLILPLLLLRMPAPLKNVIGDFLSTTFDCRISPMRLGTRSLVSSWEAWIKSAGLPSRGPLAKDVVLSLGFYVPPPDKPSAALSQPSGEDEATTATDQHLGLKSIDVIIPAAELRRLVAAGKRIAKPQNKRTASTEWGWEDDLRKRRSLAGRLYEEGWEWRAASSDRDGKGDGNGGLENQPFTEALACYLKEHLGLNLFHPGVRVIKIACGGFVMSETRLKLFAPAGSAEVEGRTASVVGQRAAVWELLGGLVGKAHVQMVVG